MKKILQTTIIAALGTVGSHAAIVWSSPLDGNANSADGNGVASGTPMATTDLNGNAGGAVLFDGAADFFTITPTVASFTTGSLSIWARIDSVPTAAETGPIAVGASGGDVDQYFILQNDGNGSWRGDVDDGAARLDVFSNAVPTSGTWQHLVLTFTMQGTLRMYVDGALQTDTQSLAGGNATLTPTNAWMIGSERTGERFFEGALDDARIYDNELTQGDVDTLFANGPEFVPEPTTSMLLGLCGTLALLRRRREA